jgi:hypothetical protein
MVRHPGYALVAQARLPLVVETSEEILKIARNPQWILAAAINPPMEVCCC